MKFYMEIKNGKTEVTPALPYHWKKSIEYASAKLASKNIHGVATITVQTKASFSSSQKSVTIRATDKKNFVISIHSHGKSDEDFVASMAFAVAYIQVYQLTDRNSGASFNYAMKKFQKEYMDGYLAAGYKPFEVLESNQGSKLEVNYISMSKKVLQSNYPIYAEVEKIMCEEIDFMRSVGIKTNLVIDFQYRPVKNAGGKYLHPVKKHATAHMVINCAELNEDGTWSWRSLENIRHIIRHEFGHMHHLHLYPNSNRWSHADCENYADSYAEKRGSGVNEWIYRKEDRRKFRRIIIDLNKTMPA